jgi:thymidylate kinase
MTTRYARSLRGDGLAALDSAGIRWSLVHGCDGGRDIDVLVAAADLSRAVAALEDLGLRRIGGWGGAGGAFLRGSGGLQFDLVTDLSFGRYGELPAPGAARECLARRRRIDGAWRLAPADEFWVLLLHCLLDRRGFADRHLRRLEQLAPLATPDSPLVGVLPRRVPVGILLAHARAGRWQALLAVRGRVVRAWWRSRPAAVAGYPVGAVRAAALRGMAPLLRAWNRRGASVALLGPDGSGKSSLAAAVAARSGLPVRRIYMGLWPRSEAPPEGPVGAALRIARRPLVVWWRYLQGLGHRARGRLVVFDRYVYDAMLPPSPPLVWLKRPYLWALSRACPAPDLAILLDAPGEVMHERCGDRTSRELAAERAQFRRIAGRIPRTVRVDTDRPPEAVLADVLGHIGQLYRTRSLR